MYMKKRGLVFGTWRDLNGACLSAGPDKKILQCSQAKLGSVISYSLRLVAAVWVSCKNLYGLKCLKFQRGSNLTKNEDIYA